MKINHSKNEIKNAVYSNLQNQAFSGLVQSAFISALPISSSEKTNPKINRALKNYCADALESLGSYSLLENAIRKETNASRLSLLNDMKNICDEIAYEAASRVANINVAMEASEDDDMEPEDETEDIPDDLTVEDEDDDLEGEELQEEEDTEPKKKILAGKTLEEIALDARLNDSEYKKLARKAESIDIPEISEVINNKVVDAINKEKDAYQEIDNANEKLKNALIENEDNSVENDIEAKEAVSRIIDKNFSSYQTREHKSIFSKLQLDATEMAMCTENASITADFLKDITYADTLSAFDIPEKTLGNAIESALNFRMANEACNPGNMEKAVKIGTMAAAIVLTLIETLNTLNLYRMSFDEAKSIVNRPNMMDNTPDAVLDSINSRSSSIISDQRKIINGSREANAIENASYKLSLLKKDLSRAVEGGINVDKKILADIDDLKELATNKIKKLDDTCAPASESAVSMTKKAQEANVINSNTIAKYISKRPTDHIYFRVTNESTIAVECFMSNRYIYGSTLKLEPVSEAVSVEKYLDNLVKTTDLGKITNHGERPKMTVINKGRRTEI